ncbi:HAD family hydrolase [[Hallella] seregens]|uniref:HAD family hydrolase n=1 Tax=Hallella seregens ATCC 51272 TaxID=1336250 RepID=A0ABV5ZMF6_9BACT|nr:HAD family hydrolase [Hallella seregens]
MPHSAKPPLTPADIRLVAFDADDTLWDNQSHFDQVEREYAHILSAYGTPDDVSGALYDVETANMPLLGYGCKAFTISLVENAVRFSHGQIAAADVLKIVELGKSILVQPVPPLPGVEETLQALRQRGRYKMVVFTKGELLDQQAKLVRSGLGNWFDDIVVVSDKTRNEYTKLCNIFDTDIGHLLMVGNSFRSDIEPVLQLGGYAAHIPFEKTWQHEQTEEYDHPHLVRLGRFAQLARLL